MLLTNIDATLTISAPRKEPLMSNPTCEPEVTALLCIGLSPFGDGVAKYAV
jgi:hypothetical protein